MDDVCILPALASTRQKYSHGHSFGSTTDVTASRVNHRYRSTRAEPYTQSRSDSKQTSQASPLTSAVCKTKECAQVECTLRRRIKFCSTRYIHGVIGAQCYAHHLKWDLMRSFSTSRREFVGSINTMQQQSEHITSHSLRRATPTCI